MISHATCFVPISASAITPSTATLVAAMAARASPMFRPQSWFICLRPLVLLFFSPQSSVLSPASSQSSYPPLINIGCGEDLTIRDLAKTIAGVVGYNGKLNYDATKPDGTMQKLMDVTRMKRLGWLASTSLRKGIHAAYLSYLEEAK